MVDRGLNYGRHLIEAFLKTAPFRNVLDLGAGHGDDLMIARGVNPDAVLLAIEAYEPYAVALTRRHVDVSSLNLEADTLPFADRSVDVVIANQLLEHTKEIFWIFHEVTRVLRPKGRFILGVPNLASLHNRLLLMVGRQPTSIKISSAHVRAFTRRGILSFLEDCFPGGYRLADFGGSNFYPFPPTLAKPMAKLLPGMAWGIFFLLEKVREYDGEFLRFPVRERLETNFYLGASNPGDEKSCSDQCIGFAL